MPFVVCVVTVLLLCKPGPPIPFLKGAVMAMVIAALLVAGVLMVPILENYAVTGVLLTGALLYAVFFAGARSANPLTIFLVIAITFIPVAGVAEQALATALGRGRWGGARHRSSGQWRFTRFFSGCSRASSSRSAARRRQSGNGKLGALQATLVVMPVFVLALTNPAFYLAAIMKTVTLGQQAGATNARRPDASWWDPP